MIPSNPSPVYSSHEAHILKNGSFPDGFAWYTADDPKAGIVFQGRVRYPRVGGLTIEVAVQSPNNTQVAGMIVGGELGDLGLLLWPNGTAREPKMWLAPGFGDAIRAREIPNSLKTMERAPATALTAMCLWEEVTEPTINKETPPWEKFREDHGTPELREFIWNLAKVADQDWAWALQKESCLPEVQFLMTFDWVFCPWWLHNCVNWKDHHALAAEVRWGKIRSHAHDTVEEKDKPPLTLINSNITVRDGDTWVADLLAGRRATIDGYRILPIENVVSPDIKPDSPSTHVTPSAGNPALTLFERMVASVTRPRPDAMDVFPR